MPFCSNCGAKLREGTKYCFECGTKVTDNNENRQIDRETVFEGKIHKCPNCGEVLEAFLPNCPSCGYELRKISASITIKDLCDKLEEIEHQPEQSSKGRSVFTRVTEAGLVTEKDKRIINLIKSFPIPNTKEDIMEFLILSSSNVDLNCHTQRETEISEAWESKFKQAYQKAKILFKDDSRTPEIEQLYTDTIKDIKKARNEVWKLYAIIGVVLVVIFSIIGISNSHAEKKEIQRLETTEIHVQEAYDNKDYKLALMYVDNLDYSLDDEKLDREWLSKQDYWIDKILTTAEAEGIHLEYERPTTTTTTTTTTSNQGLFSSKEDKTTTSVKKTPTNYTITKGLEYSYGLNEWNTYIASAVSDSMITIELWDKTMSSSKNVKYNCEVGTFKINDSENGFEWVDEAHTAFKFVLKDKNNSSTRKGKTVFFTLTNKNSDYKGANYIKNKTSYAYKNDDWNYYRAIPLTDNLIKIEDWYRSMSVGSFYYGYDVMIIDLNNNNTDFEWTDDSHDSFTITLKDKENGNLKESTFVCFKLEK